MKKRLLRLLEAITSLALVVVGVVLICFVLALGRAVRRDTLDLEWAWWLLPLLFVLVGMVDLIRTIHRAAHRP